MKQIKAHEMSFKQPQNETKLSPKPTSKSKRDRIKVQHKRIGHLQKQSNLGNLGDEVGMRVSTLNTP
jgi:hypothetical protein